MEEFAKIESRSFRPKSNNYSARFTKHQQSTRSSTDQFGDFITTMRNQTFKSQPPVKFLQKEKELPPPSTPSPMKRANLSRTDQKIGHQTE